MFKRIYNKKKADPLPTEVASTKMKNNSKKNIFIRRLDALNDEILNLIDEYGLKSKLKSKVTELFDKAAVDFTICKQLEDTKNNFILNGKNIRNENHARSIAKEITGWNAKEKLPENAIQQEVIRIGGKRNTFFKIRTADYDNLCTKKPDGTKESIGMTLITNVNEYNKSRENKDERIFVNNEIPRILKPHYNNLQHAAALIRSHSSDSKKFCTRINLNSINLRLQLQVKVLNLKTRLRNRSEWHTMDDPNLIPQLPEICKRVYKNVLIRNQTLLI